MKLLYKYIYEKWKASAKGYVNQGSDPRTFGRIGAFIQHLLSFNPKRFRPIPYATLYRDTRYFVGNPPYIAVNIPTGDGRFLHLRLGWRYDVNWTAAGGYILSAAVKILDKPLIYK